MNRITYTSDYSVPSLSLASSRSKKNIPTKDNYIEMSRPVEVKPRPEVLDRINRPPIFSSRMKDSKISIQKSTGSYQIISESRTAVAQGASLNRNVYLRQEEPAQNQLTFRPGNKEVRQQTINRPPAQIFKSPSASLLRNPESNHLVSVQIQRKLESRKIDANKVLFDRKIKKLMQEAQFYDKQLMQMYPDNSDQLAKELLELEQCRKEALSFDFGSNLVGII